jgi:DNA repair protein RadC
MMIRTARDAATLLAPIFAAAEGGTEMVAVVHLDAEQRLLAVTIEEPGRRDAVELPIGAILTTALRLGAQAIVVAHNHPSGDAAPSEEDIGATRALAEAAAAVGVRLHDHLVFAGEECRSLRELGLL